MPGRSALCEGSGEDGEGHVDRENREDWRKHPDSAVRPLSAGFVGQNQWLFQGAALTASEAPFVLGRLAADGSGLPKVRRRGTLGLYPRHPSQPRSMV